MFKKIAKYRESDQMFQKAPRGGGKSCKTETCERQKAFVFCSQSYFFIPAKFCTTDPFQFTLFTWNMIKIQKLLH